MNAGWRQLLARYDGAALKPPEAEGLPTAAGQPAFDALRLWCLAAPQQRLALALLDGADLAAASRLATQVALERDGSWQLAACSGPAARLQLRVLTKLRDAAWWRARQPSDPWDSGTLRDTTAGLQALSRFAPRRASLIVADRTTPATLLAALHSLNQRSAAFRHPVRVLAIGAAPMDWPQGLPVDHFQPRSAAG